MKKTSVLIVDDHSVVRMGLSAILNLERDLVVSGAAENGEEAIRLARELRPDVIVMDLMMPGLDGAAATRAVLDVSPDSKVLILTTFGSSADLKRALDAGATGAVTKDLSNDDLAAAIRATAVGKRHLSAEIAQTLTDEPDGADFSPRLQQILESITRGLSNDDIALQLGLSKTRVKQHIRELYDRLGAANRAEAVAIALNRHLTTPHSSPS